MTRQSVGPIIDAVRARVESLIPSTYGDVTFSIPPGNLGAGDAEAWISDVMRATRDCVVYLAGLPGLTPASSPCHVTWQLAVAVVYRAELADDVRDVMIADDVNLIISGIIARPDLWGGADNLWPIDGGATIDSIVDAENNLQTYVVTILFSVTTH